MGGRVIQGFFIGGAMRPQPAAAAHAGARHATGALPAATGRAAPLQARMAPGRPPLAHRGAGHVAQPHGGDGSFAIDPVQLGLARGGGQPLPLALLAKMEAAFGADFSGVRVHIGPQASRIGAVAFTTGNDLYFAPGQFQPESIKGQQLIGHELAHVIQQRQGRVRRPGGGMAVVQDRVLEAEADRLGMQAAAHRLPVQAKMSGFGGHGRQAPSRPQSAIQRYQGQLLAQQGPSCWLFVAEALADMQGLDTWLLVGLMHLYPAGDITNNSRSKRLKVVRNTLQGARASLQNRAIRGAATFNRAQVAEALRRGSGANSNYTAAADHLFPQDGDYAAQDVLGLLERGRLLAEALRVALQGNSDTPAVLGGAAVIIDGNSDLNDIGLTLANVGNGRAYLSVGPRPKPRSHPAQYDNANDTYDLTALGLAAIETGGSHALLLAAVDTVAQQLTYKDPNIGNSSIIISFAQLREMARRKGTISVRGMHPGSVLRNSLGAPVVRPQPVPQQPVQNPVVANPWGAVPLAPVNNLPIAPVNNVPMVGAPLVAAPVSDNWRLGAVGFAILGLVTAFTAYAATQR